MVKKSKLLITHTFKGGRFEDHGLDIDVLQELKIYKSIIVQTASEIWKRKNPEKQHLPKNFVESFRLRFYQIQQSSASIPLMREIEVDEMNPSFGEESDEFDEAVVLVNQAIHSADKDIALPPDFPKRLIPSFRNYGSSLRPDESIEYIHPELSYPVCYSLRARDHFIQLSEASYVDDVDLIGTVTMARVSKPRMSIVSNDNREIEACFRPCDEELVLKALQEHNMAKIRIKGRGTYTSQGVLHRINEVSEINYLASGEIEFDESAKPIWEIFEEAIKRIPQEEWDNFPIDGADQHDHYLYGLRKKII